jgi:hypothetical protein
MKQSMKFRGRTRQSARLFVSAAFVAAFATTGWFGSAQAAPCLTEAAGESLNCTANDLGLAGITVTQIVEACDGSPGDTFTFTGTLDSDGGTERYDLGYYIGEDPLESTQDDCSVAIIPPATFDADGDACGDSGNAPLNVPVANIVAPCQDSNGDGFFDVNTCVAYKQSANASDCAGPEDAIPGTKSKCSCDVVETSEPVPRCETNADCDDQNLCTTDVCDPTPGGAGDLFGCTITNNAVPCDDGLFCNGDDTCVNGTCSGHEGDPCIGGGVCGDNCDEATDSCFDAAGTLCRATNGICDTPETCTGSTGACPADDFEDGTLCRGSNGVCDTAETCSGTSAACPADGFSQGNTCRGSSGVCDVAETCTGQAADCPTDGFVNEGTACRASNGVCDIIEECTGGSAECPADDFEDGTLCRGSAGVCDVAENCSGESAACPADDFADGTLCRGASGVCDTAETCSGDAADCPADDFLDGTVCRTGAGICDASEVCSGSDADCPDDTFSQQGTTCRGADGVCDVAETCTGSAADCPADDFLDGTPCRGSDGICDVAENCSGDSAACPADAFLPSSTQCRADAGQCDVAENCTGAAAACPADGFEPSGTDCAIDENPCTDDECNASGVCVAGPNADTCDDGLFCNGTDTCVEGQCTGHSGDPCAGGGICGDNCQEETDSCFDSAETVCRPSGGVCDVAENCTGSTGACPADTVLPTSTTCRASGGVCDIAENCTGSTPTCPNNTFVSGTTACRSSSGVCDSAENCSGTSATCPNDTFVGSTTICRADAGDCDVAERCTGTSGSCPAQGFEPNNTPCSTDNNVCTNDVCNSNGVCQHNNNTLPCDDGQFCTVGDQCGGGECEGNPRVCGDQFACTEDSCNEQTNSCEFDPDNSECEDEDICTTDICTVTGGCQNIFSCKDICRRFGWWGKRSGDGDGEDSINVVQELLDFYGGINVCGEHIDETSDAESVAGFGLDSALEGLCVRPDNLEIRKLYRELVAASLNCHMSGAAGDDFCDSVVEKFIDVEFSECNALCAGDIEGSDDQLQELADECIEQLDCYNSGGRMVLGRCAVGTCDVTGQLCGGGYGPCPPFTQVSVTLLQVCERFDGNCRDEEFCQEGIGVCPERFPQTSGRACKEAKNNECTIDFCSIDDD